MSCRKTLPGTSLRPGRSGSRLNSVSLVGGIRAEGEVAIVVDPGVGDRLGVSAASQLV